MRGRPFTRGNPGRQKGSKNKVPAKFREALIDAFEQTGGVKSLVAWGQENQSLFYQLCSRLIPTELELTHKPDPVALVIDRVRDRAELEAARAAQDVEQDAFDDDVVDIPPPEPKRPALVPTPVPEPDPPDVPHFN